MRQLFIYHNNHYGFDHKYIIFQIEMMHRLKHPNIIELFGFGIREEDSYHFIVMEFMDGGTLSTSSFIIRYLCIAYILVLHNKNPIILILDVQLINWAIQLAEGLAFIHSHQIAHRDLKPLK
jgi:serine/threonine protein kinase